MSKSKIKRKKYLINPQFQFDFMGSFFLFYLSISSAFLIGVNLIFQNLKNSDFKNSFLFQELLTSQHSSLVLILSIGLFLILIVNLLFLLFMTHKVAGPLFKLKNHLKSMDKDNIEKIYFREKDYFKDVQDEFNLMIERLK